jgi:hypothetical protein
MRAQQFGSVDEARRECRSDEVAVAVHLVDGTVQYGVIPRFVDLSQVEGRPAEQGGPEFIANYWRLVGREAELRTVPR